MIFKEDNENLIKVFEITRETKVSYIINSLLNIINRWSKIRVYIYNIESEKNEKN